MIDTIVLAGLSDMFERDIPLQQIVEDNEVDQQLVWLEQTLAASNATWLFVCGHYPGKPTSGLQLGIVLKYNPKPETVDFP